MPRRSKRLMADNTRMMRLLASVYIAEGNNLHSTVKRPLAQLLLESPGQ